jgi:hypothetical protein
MLYPIFRVIAWAWFVLWTYPFLRSLVRFGRTPDLRSGANLCQLAALFCVPLACLMLAYGDLATIKSNPLGALPSVCLAGAAFPLDRLGDSLRRRADRVE